MPRVIVTELMHRDANGGEQVAVEVQIGGNVYSVAFYETQDRRHELLVTDKTNGGHHTLAAKKFKPELVEGLVA